MINALGRIESYVDCGVFRPIRIWSVIGLNGRAGDGDDMVENYRKRKNGPCNGLTPLCGEVQKPKATTFVRAAMANGSAPMGSMASSKLLLREAEGAPSAGVLFGQSGHD